LAAALGLGGIVPGGVGAAFAVQFAEAVWGSVNPAMGQRPARIGMRQLGVSILFTVLFIMFWR
jgi:hypothetical protein